MFAEVVVDAAFSFDLVVETFLVLWLSVEGVTENILLIGNSVGLLVFCMLIWRAILLGAHEEVLPAAFSRGKVCLQ